MTRDEAIEILNRFKRWNHSQKSFSHAFGGPRTTEDDIYDERRNLILKATKVLGSDD